MSIARVITTIRHMCPQHQACRAVSDDTWYRCCWSGVIMFHSADAACQQYSPADQQYIHAGKRHSPLSHILAGVLLPADGAMVDGASLPMSSAVSAYMLDLANGIPTCTTSEMCAWPLPFWPSPLAICRRSCQGPLGGSINDTIGSVARCVRTQNMYGHRHTRHP